MCLLLGLLLLFFVYILFKNESNIKRQNEENIHNNRKSNIHKEEENAIDTDFKVLEDE